MVVKELTSEASVHLKTHCSRWRSLITGGKNANTVYVFKMDQKVDPGSYPLISSNSVPGKIKGMTSQSLFPSM